VRSEGNLSQHDGMRLNHRQIAIQGSAIIALVVLALVGGLFHHHESASDSDACSNCHAGVQTPVIDLTAALITPFLAVIGSVTSTQVSFFPRVAYVSTLIPRAPPNTTHAVVFWEGRGMT
jgi:hypothetical protein